LVAPACASTPSPGFGRGGIAVASAALNDAPLLSRSGVHAGRLGRGRRGGRAVVELLLGPEHEVEYLRAQTLVQGDREHCTEGDQQQRATEAAAPATAHRRTFAQRAAGLPERVDRAAQLCLQLAVLEQGLAG